MQVPAPFQYEKPSTLEHALGLLARHGAAGKVLAGGHSLIPMMKLRIAAPETLIDITGLGELTGIEVSGESLAIGALATHAAVLDSAVIGAHAPIVHDAERVIADPVVRNKGTVGGSVCQADPSEDLAAVLAALRAHAEVRSARGRRTIALRHFFAGPHRTVLEPDEVLVRLHVPLGQRGSAYAKVARRSGDWPVAAVGASVRLARGRFTGVGIGLTALGATGFCARRAEGELLGAEPSEQRFARAGAIAAADCAPGSDQRGPAEYKRALAATLTARALAAATSRWYELGAEDGATEGSAIEDSATEGHGEQGGRAPRDEGPLGKGR